MGGSFISLVGVTTVSFIECFDAVNWETGKALGSNYAQWCCFGRYCFTPGVSPEKNVRF